MALRAAALVRVKPPLEKEVQRQIVTLFRHAGLQVDSTSQARASMVARGLSDLLAFGDNVFFFFEVKSYCPAGYQPMDRSTWRPHDLRPEQEAFQRKCIWAGVWYAWGGLPQAEDVLISIGLGSRSPTGVFHYHRPRLRSRHPARLSFLSAMAPRGAE